MLAPTEFFWFALYSYLVVRLLKFLYVLVKAVIVHYVIPPLDLTPYEKTWTVVTGGTDGIGRAYIDELSKTRGIRRYFLLGRNKDKLQRVAAELEKSYGCEVRTAIVDFERTEDVEKLAVELGNLDIGILINCAGTAPDRIGNLVELPPGTASTIMKVNVMSNIRMTELVLPGMVKRQRGIIVSFSSMTGWRPFPYLSSYPASKAAISFFHDALADEFRFSGVKIQTLMPLLVATKIAHYSPDEANNIWVVSTESFARQAVRMIGRPELSTGCIQHDVQIAFGTVFSSWLLKYLFVPFVLLGVHKQRVDAFRARTTKSD